MATDAKNAIHKNAKEQVSALFERAVIIKDAVIKNPMVKKFFKALNEFVEIVAAKAKETKEVIGKFTKNVVSEVKHALGLGPKPLRG